MTLKAQMAADVDSVFLNTDDFAATIQQQPAGVVANEIDVVAIFIPADPMRDDDRGEGEIHRGELYLADSVTVHLDDTWTINAQTWKTERNGDVEDGMRCVRVVRRDPIYTTHPGRAVRGR